MPAVLTTKMIEKAIRDTETYDLSDSRVPGLAIRSRPVGATWMCRVNHKKYTLGAASDMSLVQARTLATELIARVKSGFIVDPHWIQRQKVSAGIVEDGAPAPAKVVRSPTTWTWEQALEAYIAEVRRSRRPETAKNYRSVLINPSVTEVMAGRIVAEVDLTTVASMVERIHSSGREATSENVVVIIRVMWEFLARHDKQAQSGVASNVLRPLRKISRSRNYGKVTRTPTLEICGKIVAACRRGVFDPLICRALEVLVLTGQRRLTVASIATRDFDMFGNWSIPADSIKGDAEHHIPMLPRVAELLSADGDGTWMWPQMRPRKKGMPVTHVHESTLTHNMSDLGLNASPHDMRRSFTTVIVDAGLPEIYASYVLDHREGRKTVTGVHYNRALYIPEKTQALQAWEKALEPFIAKAMDLIDVAAEKAKLIEKRKTKAKYADGKRPKVPNIGQQIRAKVQSEMASEAAERDRKADELAEIDRVLDAVVDRRISDEDARHALRMTTDMKLVVAMQRRGKDLSRRPDLLQETTNRAFEKLGIKQLQEPVVHDEATMRMVVKAMEKARAEIRGRK